jgi:hypothetical protein
MTNEVGLWNTYYYAAPINIPKIGINLPAFMKWALGPRLHYNKVLKENIKANLGSNFTEN